MAAEKLSITVSADLVAWARTAAKRQRTTLSAFVAEALQKQKEHHARERYLEKALAGIPADELAEKTAEAYREIFGDTGAA